MDPASLIFGIITVFKDGYLVARYIYHTINSGLKHAEERIEISQRFRQQLLFLQSFGCWFVKSKGRVTNDDGLNRAWLLEIRDILERFNLDLAEYRNLAEKSDENYRRYSPSLNPAYQTSGLIEFELGEELPQLNEPSLIGNIGKLFSKKVLRDIYLSGDWALFRKRKLSNLAVKFEKRNKTLRHILQIAVPAQIQATSVSGIIADRWLETEHVDRLGLRGHVQITQIQQAKVNDVQGLEIKRSRLICQISDSIAIIPAILKTENAHHNSKQQRVLVEYKNYEITGVSGSVPDDEHERANRSEERRFNQVAKLAALLHSSGFYGLGTLPFKGFIHEQESRRYAFVFNLPEDVDPETSPQNLHSLIRASPWPLAQRFYCARKIASILEAINNDGWVHKSVRSHSVTFFCHYTSQRPDVSRPYLTNFEYSRLHYNTTTLERDEDSVKDLYRHPALQVSNRQDAFTCVHDIYALGVILLEIALWRTASQIVEDYSEEKPHTADEVRRLYIKVAELEVPWLMGDAFLEAIKACLSRQYESEFVMPDHGLFHKKVIQNLSPKALDIKE